MFEAAFESLYKHKCPDWFRDVKFGIWSHWGPQSVPMFGDWYARNMYIQGSEQYNYHLAHYGHPSEFGYKDIVKLWKAENFDPDALMEQYYKSGARFFVAQATHHDNFFNYATKLNRFNSVEIGPHKDIVGMWQKAAKKYDLPFGITEHLAASFWWWWHNKDCDKTGPYAGVPYDGANPEYADFYHDNMEHVNIDGWPWLTQNEKFKAHWLEVMKEIVDLYHPEMLYSDSHLPFGQYRGADAAELFKEGLEAVSYFYNDCEKTHGPNQAVYTQKSENPDVYRVGTLDVERSQLHEISPEPWQSETCIGDWFFNSKINYKTPKHIIDILIDTISKNGTLLLNIIQKPDGTVDDRAMWILKELEKWFAINSEAVYCTRPWRVAGEGSAKVKIEGFTEEQVAWQQDDFRFVQKKAEKAVYCYMMCPHMGDKAIIKSFKPDEIVNTVTLLGGNELSFNQYNGVLVVDLPKKLPTEYANVLKIQL